MSGNAGSRAGSRARAKAGTAQQGHVTDGTGGTDRCFGPFTEETLDLGIAKGNKMQTKPPVFQKTKAT